MVGVEILVRATTGIGAFGGHILLGSTVVVVALLLARIQTAGVYSAVPQVFWLCPRWVWRVSIVVAMAVPRSTTAAAAALLLPLSRRALAAGHPACGNWSIR